jgi:PEGA domain
MAGRAIAVATSAAHRTLALRRTLGIVGMLGAVGAVGTAWPRGAAAQAAEPPPAAAQPAEPPRAAPDGDIEIARDAAAPDPRAARKWLLAGQQLMQRGAYLAARNRPDDAKQQFESAATAFARAIEAGGDVNVYLDLANAQDKLGKLDDAYRHVRRVLDATTGVRPDIAKRAAAKRDDLLARIGLVTLRVVPAGTSITLGGLEIGTSPLPEPLVLIPGTYTLSFQAEGFQPREAVLEVEPGSESERTIELEAVKVVVQPVAPPVDLPAPPPRLPAPSRLPLFVGAGVTAVAIAGASALGILAIREHDTFTSPSTGEAGREDARDRGRRLALLSDASLATAAIAAGFTAYWYIYRYRQHPNHPSRNPGHNRAHNLAKLAAVPWVQPGSGGMAIAARF